MLVAAQALREGMSVADIHTYSKFDPWFLERLAEIITAEGEVKAGGLPQDAEGMRRLKAMGFSDKRLAFLALESVHVPAGMETAVRHGSGLIAEAVRAMAGGGATPGGAVGVGCWPGAGMGTMPGCPGSGWSEGTPGCGGG